MERKELRKFMKKMHCMQVKAYNGELLPKGDFWKPDRESPDILGVYYDGKWISVYSDRRCGMISKRMKHNTEETACQEIAGRITKIRDKERALQEKQA